jgi:ADP-heptose:LPS heptosyltransferase
MARFAPYRRQEIHVARGGAMGDVLMCTPALRDLKRLNPHSRLTFYTDFAPLVEGLPFIDAVRPVEERPDDIIFLTYEQSLPPHRHISRIMGDRLGVDVQDTIPSCVVHQRLIDRYTSQWSRLPRPIVVITRSASAWTPNKNWPEDHWNTLVARLATRMTVVDVGNPAKEPPEIPEGHYLDLRGKTSLTELVAVIGAADLHIAPITGTVHIAASMGVPSVVIYGGYEHPDCSSYAGNINLYSPVECAPCWLRDPCPFAKKCLTQISPSRVEDALNQLWNSRRRYAIHAS